MPGIHDGADQVSIVHDEPRIVICNQTILGRDREPRNRSDIIGGQRVPLGELPLRVHTRRFHEY